MVALDSFSTAPQPHPDLLPPTPALLLRLRALQGCSTRPGLGELVALLEGRPELASTLLRVINVLHRNLPGRFANLRIATAYLGTGEIARLAAALIVIEEIADNEATAAEHLRRALLTTTAIAELGRIIEPSLDPADLLPATLLYDIGVLVRPWVDPSGTARIHAQRRKHRSSLIEAELALGCVPHTELGAQLCVHWALGRRVEAACLCHEDDVSGFQSGPRRPTTKEERGHLRLLIGAERATKLALGSLLGEQRQRLQAEISAVFELPSEQALRLLMARVDECRHAVDYFCPRAPLSAEG